MYFKQRRIVRSHNIDFCQKNVSPFNSSIVAKFIQDPIQRLSEAKIPLFISMAKPSIGSWSSP